MDSRRICGIKQEFLCQRFLCQSYWTSQDVWKQGPPRTSWLLTAATIDNFAFLCLPSTYSTTKRPDRKSFPHRAKGNGNSTRHFFFSFLNNRNAKPTTQQPCHHVSKASSPRTRPFLKMNMASRSRIVPAAQRRCNEQVPQKRSFGLICMNFDTNVPSWVLLSDVWTMTTVFWCVMCNRVCGRDWMTWAVMVISDNMTIQNFILVTCPAVCVLLGLFFLKSNAI